MKRIVIIGAVLALVVPAVICIAQQVPPAPRNPRLPRRLPQIRRPMPKDYAPGQPGDHFREIGPPLMPRDYAPGQVPGPSPAIPYAQRPRNSRVIELCEATTCSTVVVWSPHPLGVDMASDKWSSLLGTILILKVYSSGSSGTLQATFQSSCDDGQSWAIVAFISPTTTGTWYIPVSAAAPFNGFPPTIADGGSFAGGGVNNTYQGPIIGNRIRINCASSIAGSSWQFQAFALTN